MQIGKVAFLFFIFSAVIAENAAVGGVSIQVVDENGHPIPGVKFYTGSGYNYNNPSQFGGKISGVPCSKPALSQQGAEIQQAVRTSLEIAPHIVIVSPANNVRTQNENNTPEPDSQADEASDSAAPN